MPPITVLIATIRKQGAILSQPLRREGSVLWEVPSDADHGHNQLQRAFFFLVSTFKGKALLLTTLKAPRPASFTHPLPGAVQALQRGYRGGTFLPSGAVSMLGWPVVARIIDRLASLTMKPHDRPGRLTSLNLAVSFSSRYLRITLS
jgi:hypothetical protein